MTTRRMGHGMAVSPEKDLELFAGMDPICFIFWSFNHTIP